MVDPLSRVLSISICLDRYVAPRTDLAEREEAHVSLEIALLGFLTDRPMTGYDMKKMTDDVGPSWTAPQSQIYDTLHRLEKRGLVTVEVIHQDTKPNRKLYRMMPEGEKTLADWMSVAHPPRVLRNPFLLQLWFTGLVDDAVVLRFLEESAEELRKYVTTLESKPETIRALDDAPPRDRFFKWMTLNYGVRHARFQIAWIEETIARVREKEYEDGKAGALRGVFEDV
jgi:DNA-binding PadR family transcriptional regulator